MERTLLEIGRREMRPLVVSLAGAAVLSFVFELIAVPGLSLFALMAIVFLIAAVTVYVGSSPASPVLTVGPQGIRFWSEPRVAWGDVQAFVLIDREVVEADGPGVEVQAVLTSVVVPADEALSVSDARVVAWINLPGALQDVDAAERERELHVYRPGLLLQDRRTHGARRELSQDVG
jgi:hypothetical protein